MSSWWVAGKFLDGMRTSLPPRTTLGSAPAPPVHSHQPRHSAAPCGTHGPGVRAPRAAALRRGPRVTGAWEWVVRGAVARPPGARNQAPAVTELGVRARGLLPSVRIFEGHGGRMARGLQGAWDHREGAPGRRDWRRSTRRGVALALAQLAVDLSDGRIEPLQQEIQDGRETVGLHFGNILQGDLAVIEGVNHGHRGHMLLLVWCRLGTGPIWGTQGASSQACLSRGVRLRSRRRRGSGSATRRADAR